MMICIAIKGPTLQEVRHQIQEAMGYADLVELRLDEFENFDLDELRSLRLEFPIPMIFTLRSRSQGGNYKGSEEERLAEIRRLADLEPEYLDVENEVQLEFIMELTSKYPAIKIISSYHNFDETPKDIDELYSRMRRTAAYYYKIAVTPKNSLEALRFVIWAKRQRGKLIAISMGTHGQISRIVAPFIGSPITYASLEEKQNTAPGQLSAKMLTERYHHRLLNLHSGIYGLIGDPVDKSMSDTTHNSLMAECGLDAVYVKIHVKPEELADFVQIAKLLPFQGLSVTMPLKEHILPYLDVVDPQAKEIGAVNTLVFTNGKVAGFNTDGIGALNAIESISLVKGKHLVIIGAGGAAKAIGFEGLKRGARVTIVNRDAEKAVVVAQRLKCKGMGLDQMSDCAKAGYDILINCTPVDMPIRPEDILSHAIVMDIKSKPKDTEFLKYAQAKGCSIVYGYQMFVEQAIGQFKLWFGDRIDVEKCRDILKREAEKF